MELGEKTLKNLTVLFGLVVGGIAFSFGATVYLALQQHQEGAKQTQSGVVPTPGY